MPEVNATKISLPLDGVTIDLTFRSPDGLKRYQYSPVDNNPELLKYLLANFVDMWMRDSAYLREKK